MTTKICIENEDEISHDNIKEREDEDKKGPSIYENFCFNISQLVRFHFIYIYIYIL